jgi:hypothetical protein
MKSNVIAEVTLNGKTWRFGFLSREKAVDWIAENLSGITKVLIRDNDQGKGETRKLAWIAPARIVSTYTSLAA